MNALRKGAALAALALAFGVTGCKSDDAAKKDIRDATEDVQGTAKDAGKKLDEAKDDVGDAAEKAVPGDKDKDGK